MATAAVLNYSEPDLSVPASARGFFALPANKAVHPTEVNLIDAREHPTEIDTHGFKYIKHKSKLDFAQPLTEEEIRDIYIPEICDLVCKATGATHAAVNSVALRGQLPKPVATSTNYRKNGDELDELLKSKADSSIRITGAVESERIGPVKVAHMDYTPLGLRRAVRYSTKHVHQASQKVLDAEDRADGVVPRYAAFSIWRPLHTIKRDPLAVCDYRSLDITKDLVSAEYRCISEINDDGEYCMESVIGLLPGDSSKHQWYWMPNQDPTDVLIIKFADTQSGIDPSVSAGGMHVSPDIPGTENEEPRQSMEVRLFAYLD